MASFDLTTTDGVLAYLESNFPAYSGVRAEPISGGNANFVFRIYLKQDVHIYGIKESTIVLKHAAPYSASSQDFPLPIERQSYEVLALRCASKLFDASSLARPPAVLEYDAASCTILMSDAGPGSQTLKSLLLSNALPPPLASQVGSALGEFISRIHEHGRSAPERTEFAKHQWARKISLWLTHGRVMESVDRGILDPPVQVSQSQHALIKASIDHMQNLFLNSEETILMGDFWTGNILVQLKEDESGEKQIEKVLVVDWEVSKLGVPGNDLGQFAAEVHLPLTYFPSCATAANALMTGFCLAYKSGVRGFDQEIFSTASKQLGSHLLIVGAHYSPWKDDQGKLRQVVADGLSYLTGSTPAILQNLQ